MAPPKTSSHVPQHLRAFFTPVITTEPTVEFSYPSSVPPSSSHSSRTVITYPSHRSLVPKRNWREIAADIVLKDWRGTCRHAALKTRAYRRTSRPVIMRVKDSDDYITARAANPRTGLISPSVSSNSPRPQVSTPATPGEALELLLADEQPPSQYPDARIRPPLNRADERREISHEGCRRWRTDGEAWFTDNAVLVTSPRVAHIKAEAVGSKSVPALHDDRFVVRMPSANEPQPYAYPGFSSRQIEAFEHRNLMARQPSVEDCRTGAAQKCEGGKESDGLERIVHHYRSDLAAPKLRTGTNVKSNGRNRPCDVPVPAPFKAACFAPYSSPKAAAPARAHHFEYTMEPIPREAKNHIPRKPVDAPSRHRDGTVSPTAGIQPFTKDQRVVDLGQLPQVQLVHPSAAALPRSHNQSRDANALRTCSLGCHKDPGGKSCIERRVASNTAVPFEHSQTPSKGGAESVQEWLSATTGKRSEHEFLPYISEALVTATLAVIAMCKHIHVPALPRITLVDVLYSETATQEEKASALKTMMSAIVQVVVFLSVAAMLWHLGGVAMQALQVLLWPFMIPLKILRWMAGAA